MEQITFDSPASYWINGEWNLKIGKFIVVMASTVATNIDFMNGDCLREMQGSGLANLHLQ